MKTSLLVLLMAMGVQTSAFAGTGDVGSVGTASADIDRESLSQLLRVNPLAKSADSETNPFSRVSDLVASSMLSSFDDKGRGTLTVIDNACSQVGVVGSKYTCVLNLHNSDRQITKNGSYAQSPDMTESAMIIQYTYSIENGQKKISEVQFFIAG